MLTTALFWVSLGMSVVSFVVFVVLSARTPPAAPPPGGAGAMERQAGLSDVAKLAEAIAKLVDAFAKAKPSAAAATCSVIFLLVALAAAGIDKTADSGSAHAAGAAGNIDARLDALDAKVSVRINELEAKLTSRIDDINTKLSAQLEAKITTVINAKLESMAHAQPACAPSCEPARPVQTHDGHDGCGSVTIIIGGTKVNIRGGRQHRVAIRRHAVAPRGLKRCVVADRRVAACLTGADIVERRVPRFQSGWLRKRQPALASLR
jgi:hypothetical protein